MSPGWLAREQTQAVLRATRFLHVSGISLAISPQTRETALQAMQQARAAGAQTAFDANLRLKLWTLDDARAGIAQAMALADVFLPSIDDVTALSGLRDPREVIAWGHQAGARVVVVKLGADGCVVSDGTRKQRLPGHRVQAADATGAGDCFSGNLLARLAAGDDVFTAARYANAAAALAVQGWGAVAPLPRPDQVRALL
jgi:2-dehydro-3-deoxygluconokinase